MAKLKSKTASKSNLDTFLANHRKKVEAAKPRPVGRIGKAKEFLSNPAVKDVINALLPAAVAFVSNRMVTKLGVKYLAAGPGAMLGKHLIPALAASEAALVWFALEYWDAAAALADPWKDGILAGTGLSLLDTLLGVYAPGFMGMYGQAQLPAPAPAPVPDDGSTPASDYTGVTGEGSRRIAAAKRTTTVAQDAPLCIGGASNDIVDEDDADLFTGVFARSS